MRPLACAIGLALSALALAAPPRTRADHPFVGAWSFVVPGTSCQETYYVRPGGTVLVTSSEEVLETEYEIDDRPVRGGFFRLTDRVVKGNGRKDCLGQLTPVGQTTTHYVRFDPSGDVMILCRDASTRACIGPLRRVRGQAT